MNNVKKLALTAAASVALAVSGSAISGSSTGTISVTASIPASCTVASSTNLSAGSYDPTQHVSSNFDFSSAVNLTCTNGTAATVGLDAGTGTGATINTRKMTGSGTNTLNYSIYQDSGHATVWGNTIGSNTESDTGTGLQQSLTLYGRIFSGQQTATVDSYSDSVTITVSF